MKLQDYLCKLNKNKKLRIVLWVLCLILFLIAFRQYSAYKKMKLLYNKGVKNYREENYDQAEQYFRSALWEKKTKSQECKIRINLALSICTPITPDIVTPDNLDEYIERLEYARDFLVENDCAHMSDSKGHNKKAQKLKEDIDNYIEELKKQNPQPEPEEKKDQGQSEEEKQKIEEEKRKEQEKQQKLKDAFNQIEQQGLSERNEQLGMFEEWSLDNYYSGKSW